MSKVPKSHTFDVSELHDILNEHSDSSVDQDNNVVDNNLKPQNGKLPTSKSEAFTKLCVDDILQEPDNKDDLFLEQFNLAPAAATASSTETGSNVFNWQGSIASLLESKSTTDFNVEDECLFKVLSVLDAEHHMQGKEPNSITSLCCSPSFVVLGTLLGDVLIFKWNGMFVAKLKRAAVAPITCLTFADNNELLVGGNTAGEMIMWSIKKFKRIYVCSDYHRSDTLQKYGTLSVANLGNRMVLLLDSSGSLFVHKFSYSITNHISVESNCVFSGAKGEALKFFVLQHPQLRQLVVLATIKRIAIIDIVPNLIPHCNMTLDEEHDSLDHPPCFAMESIPSNANASTNLVEKNFMSLFYGRGRRFCVVQLKSSSLLRTNSHRRLATYQNENMTIHLNNVAVGVQWPRADLLLVFDDAFLCHVIDCYASRDRPVFGRPLVPLLRQTIDVGFVNVRMDLTPAKLCLDYDCRVSQALRRAGSKSLDAVLATDRCLVLCQGERVCRLAPKNWRRHLQALLDSGELHRAAKLLMLLSNDESIALRDDNNAMFGELALEIIYKLFDEAIGAKYMDSALLERLEFSVKSIMPIVIKRLLGDEHSREQYESLLNTCTNVKDRFPIFIYAAVMSTLNAVASCTFAAISMPAMNTIQEMVVSMFEDGCLDIRAAEKFLGAAPVYSLNLDLAIKFLWRARLFPTYVLLHTKAMNDYRLPLQRLLDEVIAASQQRNGNDNEMTDCDAAGVVFDMLACLFAGCDYPSRLLLDNISHGGKLDGDRRVFNVQKDVYELLLTKCSGSSSGTVRYPYLECLLSTGQAEKLLDLLSALFATNNVKRMVSNDDMGGNQPNGGVLYDDAAGLLADEIDSFWLMAAESFAVVVASVLIPAFEGNDAVTLQLHLFLLNFYSTLSYGRRATVGGRSGEVLKHLVSFLLNSRGGCSGGRDMGRSEKDGLLAKLTKSCHGVFTADDVRCFLSSVKMAEVFLPRFVEILCLECVDGVSFGNGLLALSDVKEYEIQWLLGLLRRSWHERSRTEVDCNSLIRVLADSQLVEKCVAIEDSAKLDKSLEALVSLAVIDGLLAVIVPHFNEVLLAEVASVQEIRRKRVVLCTLLEKIFNARCAKPACDIFQNEAQLVEFVKLLVCYAPRSAMRVLKTLDVATRDELHVYLKRQDSDVQDEAADVAAIFCQRCGDGKSAIEEIMRRPIRIDGKSDSSALMQIMALCEDVPTPFIDEDTTDVDVFTAVTKRLLLASCSHNNTEEFVSLLHKIMSPDVILDCIVGLCSEDSGDSGEGFDVAGAKQLAMNVLASKQYEVLQYRRLHALVLNGLASSADAFVVAKKRGVVVALPTAAADTPTGDGLHLESSSGLSTMVQ